MILRQNVLATLAYYDVLDMPLTAEEVLARLINFKHLPRAQSTPGSFGIGQAGYGAWTLPGLRSRSGRFGGVGDAGRWTLDALRKELAQLVLDRVIDVRENSRTKQTHAAGPRGFVRDKYYFLDDREYLVPLRIKREKIAKRKWRIARRAVWWLRSVPYVRAVFASGSLAMRNTDELSDLDVLIVAKHGRIWLTRFLITGLLSLLRVRRHGSDKIAPDKICLNHYITDKSLYIPYHSIYTAQTYANLVPIYIGDESVVDDFVKDNNWVLDYVGQWNFQGSTLKANTKSNMSRLSVEVRPQQRPKLLEWFLDRLRLADILEKWLRRYQSRRIGSNPEIRQPGGRIIFNDNQLEFHPRSIEARIVNEYNQRLARLGLADLAREKDSGLTHS